MQLIVFPSEARAEATYNSDAFASHGKRGVRLYLKVTAETGTATLDVKLQGKDTLTGDFVDVAGASFAQQSATGNVLSLTVYPGIAETNNVSVSDVLPDVWRVVATVGGASVSMTFTVGAELLP